MNVTQLISVRTRADAKLRYAQLMLDELKTRGGNGGTDFDRAYQEALLFHLLGAKDAFIAELNVYYSAGLDERQVSIRALSKELEKRGIHSPELTELHRLQMENASWLSNAKEMRDHSTHVAGFPRAFHLGGANHGKVFPKNPTTGVLIEAHVTDVLTQWLDSMTVLLNRLRAQAITAMHATRSLSPATNGPTERQQ